MKLCGSIITLFASMLVIMHPAWAVNHVISAAQTNAMMRSDFSAGEHVRIGNQVILRFPEPNHDQHGDARRLTMSNGLQLTYGEIVSLGDFYGLPEHPISSGKTQADQINYFTQSFEQFANLSAAVGEVPKLLEVINDEIQAVQSALDKGESVEAVYKKISEDHNRRYNCITGGGCGRQWWLNQGRYLKLARMNHDHFGPLAYLTYTVGHRLAMKMAIKAHKQHNMKLLEKAYAVNAFACHFLSDIFSMGHLRTPRQELEVNVVPAMVGALLSHFMHHEEGVFGLHVHNDRGDHWVGFGDKHYFDQSSAEQRHIIALAMQQSADEVFAAYDMQQVSPDEVKALIPHPDTINNEAGIDLAPLFYWDADRNQLYRREDLNNPFDFHFTTNWWGWTTFWELSSIYGMPKGITFKR